MADLKVVVRFRDGRVLKGGTQNFWPEKARFHLLAEGDAPGRATEIAVRDLKAVFVVRSFEGDAGRTERKLPPSGGAMNGTAVRVRFSDGETICGTTLNRDPSAPGFYVFPFDSASNNIRVFVVNDSVSEVETIRAGAGI